MTRNSGPNCFDPASKDREFFQSLADAETSKGALGASIGLHSILLLFLILLPLAAPRALIVSYRTVTLAPPPDKPAHTEVVPLRPPPQAPPVKLRLQQPELLIERHPEPKVPTPKALTPEEVRIPAVVPKPDPLIAASILPPAGVPKPVPNLPPPQPPVLTNVFSNVMPSAANAPARNLEAAGFGDVSSAERGRAGKPESAGKVGGFDVAVAGSAERGRAGKPESAGKVGGFDVAVAGSAERGRAGKPESAGKVGGFDVAAAGSAGRGRAGKPENAGKVGGFEAAVATGDRGGTGNRGSVLDSGFAAVPKAAPANSQKPVVQEDIEKPVEITDKPRPDYTDEARKMRIEGEVLLRVLFKSSGEAHVLDVLRGLGHGLNENAIRAAEQIRFKPAQRDSRPADSTAIVHIVFQLAY